MRTERRRLLQLAAAGLAGVWAAPALAEEPSGGPTHLLITYRAAAANRPAFREHLAGPARRQFEAWRRAGVLASFDLLFNPYNDAGTWDAMTILSFPSYGAVARWRRIERQAPGGLSPEGLRLGVPVMTYSADLPWQGVAPLGPAEAGEAVYYVIPYQYSNAEAYRRYVKGYVLPQFRGWIAEGVLAGYRIFWNRYPVGKPWDALFVLQYRDHESFGRREETVAKVRGPLREDPTWKGLNDIKSEIRSEDENTIAEALVGP